MTSYTDNIKVKISEKYKPPPRINLAVTYAQRLKLNKQLQDNIPSYDFSTEMCVCEKMNKWRENKSLFLNERQSKLALKRQKLDEYKKEPIEDIKLTPRSESLSTSTVAINSTDITVGINYSQSTMKYTSPSTMLIPTQASNNYTNILKPTQLQNFGKQLSNREVDKKSTFNLSDFEYDTSSPFDNMELKSINDLEELAHVLNQEDNDQRLKNNPALYVQSNAQTFQTEESQPSNTNYNNYIHSSYSGNQYLSNIPGTLSSFKPNNENFIYSNGYKYPFEFSQFNQQYQTPYTWARINNDCMPFQITDIEKKKSNCKSVPDLTNALEVELEKSHISDSCYSKSLDQSKSNVQDDEPKNVEISAPHKIAHKEKFLNLMTKNEQELCKSISMMGFPIERVARVLKVLGNDEKKIVEHLLAMSDLLDLGFHEKDVSNALFECDNDRDKALDKLIT